MMVNLPLFRMKSSATSNHFPFIIHLRSRLAKCWTTFPARLTMPATRNKCTDDMIALLKICHPFTYLRSEEHTSELQSRFDLVCRLLLEEKTNIASDVT